MWYEFESNTRKLVQDGLDTHTTTLDPHTFRMEKFEKAINTLTTQMKEVQYVCFQDVDSTNRFQQVEEQIFKIVS